MVEKQNAWRYEQKANRVAEQVGAGINKLGRKVDAVDNWWKKTKQEVFNKINDVKNSASRKIDQWFAFAKNIYKNAPKKLEEKRESTKTNVKRTVDSSAKYAANKIVEIDSALKDLDEWMKRGTIKAIRWSVEKWTIGYLVWKKYVEVNIQKMKQDANKIANLMKEGAIRSVQVVESGGEAIIDTGRWVVKVTIVAGVSVWLFIYKNGSYVVDQTKINFDRTVKAVQSDINTVKRNVGEAVTTGKRNAADTLRKAADKLDK